MTTMLIESPIEYTEPIRGFNSMRTRPAPAQPRPQKVLCPSCRKSYLNSHQLDVGICCACEDADNGRSVGD